MPIADGLSAVPLASSAEKLIAIKEPPAWTRLEPQSVSWDPSPALEARVADPLFLCGRQWQLGEFEGEDGGSPISVRLAASSDRITGLRSAATGTVQALTADDLLEPLVERMPAGEAGLRRRAMGGAQFLAMVQDAAVREAVLAACPLEHDADADPYDSTGAPLARLFAGRVPDGEKIAEALRAPAAPGWLPATALAAAREWLEWYQGAPAADCWTAPRLEYGFDLSVAGQVLTSSYGGGRIDWHDFDLAPTAPTLDTGDAPATGRAPTVLATPLRYTGMPADRYWQFEDGQVNLGALEVRPHDLARLIIAEFGLVHSQDWLVVPLEVPCGSLTTLGELSYTTTFGDTITVSRAEDEGFSMYEIPGVPGLLVPPAAPATLEGRPLEEVHYLRDEAANMVWAVERVVEAPSGDPRTRLAEAAPPSAAPGAQPLATHDYLLASPVPEWWIPFVPVAVAPGVVALRKGALRKGNRLVEPLGRLLEPGRPLTVQDEEIPREGVRAQRVPVLARRADGRYERWTARRTSIGRGEGASHLAFDSAIPRTAS
ncbi:MULTISPECIES: hypothetical protein [Amycolatopsis]|uniref:Uncharacterized protein n=2 Tax=Amycolatopsis TaxID=1813 RepID=A0A1I4BQN2_9PSEU|nr:hypothetical protein [Amycolatopsis sacchari]SFK70276.1 hypothetical protein SAMN05421835_12966 [Amycolatopsis sacchari]